MIEQAKSPKFSPEVRERAVRMVFEHRSDHSSQCGLPLIARPGIKLEPGRL
jgi:hypothetical protein